MAELDLSGISIYYEDSGGPGEPVVFSHGLLMSSAMFEAQVAALAPRYRCIAYDHRGQGRSADPGGRVHTIEETYHDAVALIEKLGIGPCHFVGLSMGGFVGMRLAARRPDLVRSVVLMETSADPEPKENIGRYTLLTAFAQWLGVGIVVSRVMPILFGRYFLTDPSCADARAAWRKRLSANRRGVVRAVRGVIEREGVADEIRAITAPTLVIVGDQDVATTPEKAQRIAALVPGARLTIIPNAGHSSSVEQPALVSQAIADFIGAVR
jgi:pimeloyl-ACP methyl ester carboxylesterase